MLTFYLLILKIELNSDFKELNLASDARWVIVNHVPPPCLVIECNEALSISQVYTNHITKYLFNNVFVN